MEQCNTFQLSPRKPINTTHTDTNASFTRHLSVPKMLMLVEQLCFFPLINSDFLRATHTLLVTIGLEHLFLGHVLPKMV